MKTRSWSSSVGIMLVPSTLTGWYRKMMKNAETASEIRMSRSHLANTSGMRPPRARGFPGSVDREGVPTDSGTLGSVGMKLMVGLRCSRHYREHRDGRRVCAAQCVSWFVWWKDWVLSKKIAAEVDGMKKPAVLVLVVVLAVIAFAQGDNVPSFNS